MATIDEIKIKGRAYRIWDAVNSIWKRISYWTAASDVEFEDGLNLEEKVSEMENTIDDAVEEMNDNLNDTKAELNDQMNTIRSNYIRKTQLTFVLSGSDLYITKNY